MEIVPLKQMECMEKTAVLMSTFNGERYLEEQIESILHQEGTDVCIIVRDDGSSDNTLSILEDYKKHYENKFHIIEGDNTGWKKSFFELISYAITAVPGFDYYAFADQDDIWLPEKLGKAISQLSLHIDKPALYCSNLFYYKNGENLGVVRHSDITPTYKNCLCRNYASGCTIVFNNSLLKILNDGTPNLEIAHDYWLYMVARLCGDVIIDNDAYILYRQHDSNQIGSKTSVTDIWKRRLKSFKKSIHSHYRETYAKELLRIHKGRMNPEAIQAVSKMAEYRSSFRSKMRLLFDTGYTLGNPANDLILRLRAIIGIL